MKRKKAGFILAQMALNAVFIILCFMALLPILYALSVALNAKNTIITTGLSLIPEEVTLDNFKTILFEKPFFLWFKNSIILSLGSVIFALSVSIPAAYGFSRFRFKGRKQVLYLLLMLNAFPAILSMFALYRALSIAGLINRFIGLTAVYTGSMAIFSIWNLKGYFDTIPVQIEEAARIDGCSDGQLVWRIVLPLARPSIIVTAMMVLIFVWNEYVFAVQFMTGADKYTLAAGLYSLQATDYTRNWPLFSSASILVSVPVLVVFFMIQKYMVSGLTAGGVKE